MATDNNKGSDKYGKAVAQATGKAPAAEATEGPAEGNALMPAGAKAMISKPDKDQIEKLMHDGSLEFAPQVHTMEEEEMVKGILEGEGPPAEFTQFDQVTKETSTRTVKTWIIASPDGGLRISILSSAQLDRKLPPFIGGEVTIIRGKDIKTKGGGGAFRVTDYLVCGPKNKDGTRRSWVQPHVIDAQSIEASATNQLPERAGGEDARA